MTIPQSKKLISALCGIIKDALCGGREVAREEQAMSFSFIKLGGLALSRAEAQKIHEAADILIEFYPKVARKSILNELQKFCCELIPFLETGDLSKNIARKLPALITLINELQNQTTTVYHQISGIELKLKEWDFGSAKIMHGNHPDIDVERVQIISLDGQTPQPLKPEVIVAQLRVEGETTYATKHAGERVQEILDCLQFLSIPENKGSWDGNITSFSLLCCEPIPLVSSRTWSFSSNGPKWVGWESGAPIPITGPVKCRINEKTSAQFATRGGNELSQMLKEKCPSSFDKALLVAITWIANGIRERDFARKFLSFHIALEALFGRDNKESRQAEGFQKAIMPMEEGVAFLLGRTVVARKELKEQIVMLARTRNRIVHRGYTEIDRTNLIRVANYACNCCYEAAVRRHLFQNENSFSEWLLNLKYGNADINAPSKDDK